ncbi:MAG: hypothetical protein Q8903_10610 [Bacteroidota bacterium]|nr:hypothetical protein [Bacteroidota bacterium]
MNKNLLLWLVSFIVLYIICYIHAVTESSFPISGSLLINGQNFIYKLDKSAYTTKQPVVKIYSEGINSYYPVIQWSNRRDFASIDSLKMNYENGFFIGTLPIMKQPGYLNYRLKISTNKEVYYIPENSFVTMKYEGNIPSSILGVYYIALYVGLLLSIRLGLEYFSKSVKYRKLVFFIIALFFVHAFAINPLMQSFRLGVFNKHLPAISDIFLIYPLLIFLAWAICLIAIFKFTTKKTPVIITSIATILIYLCIRN